MARKTVSRKKRSKEEQGPEKQAPEKKAPEIQEPEIQSPEMQNLQRFCAAQCARDRNNRSEKTKKDSIAKTLERWNSKKLHVVEASCGLNNSAKAIKRSKVKPVSVRSSRRASIKNIFSMFRRQYPKPVFMC